MYFSILYIFTIHVLIFKDFKIFNIDYLIFCKREVLIKEFPFIR